MKKLSAFFLLAAFASCNTPAENTPEVTEVKTGNTAPPANTPEVLCFRNEVVFKDDPNKKDVTELQLSITGAKVTGTYNWLPAEKDQRKGTLSGTLAGKTISATYNAMQEGIESIVPLKIRLAETEAMVTGENPEQGLDATLAKVSCE